MQLAGFFNTISTESGLRRYCWYLIAGWFGCGHEAIPYINNEVNVLDNPVVVATVYKSFNL